MIRYGFSLPGERSDIDLFDNTNIEIITCNNGCGVIIDEWEKLGTLTPQYGQHLGQSSETIFLLMEILMSNLKPHLIREIQKNPNWYLRYWNVKFLISEINPKESQLILKILKC